MASLQTCIQAHFRLASPQFLKIYISKQCCLFTCSSWKNIFIAEFDRIFKMSDLQGIFAWKYANICLFAKNIKIFVYSVEK